jgi:Holliday junction resolvase
MNNKKIGSDFEKEMCRILSDLGYWVHFISPDARGAQPFDIIAAKHGRTVVIDCKTCVSKFFSKNRLEDNQIYAFEKWKQCGNEEPIIAVKHDGKIYLIRYQEIKKKPRINLEEREPQWNSL